MPCPPDRRHFTLDTQTIMQINHYTRKVFRPAAVAACVAALFGLLTACSEDPGGFPSAEGKATPYILKEGCTFSIVEQLSRASISSPEVSGMPGATGSASISLGNKSITVSDCRVTANSHSLPIYEQ